MVVDIGDRAVIAMARVARFSVRHWLGVHRANVAQASRMRIECVLRDCARWHVDVFVPIKIPIALRRGEGVVRMTERGDQQEGPLILGARDVEDRALSREGGFVVEVELVSSYADPGLLNRAHVVIPARTMLWAIPVRRPVKVGGIDVGRQPLLESV